jgi:hypothetical protein
MRTSLAFVTGMALGVFTVFGCATSFPWRYYATKMPDQCYDTGTLLGKSGKEGWPDAAMLECKPDAQVKTKCITVLVDDFYSLKTDDQKCHNDLQLCQRGAKPVQ